MVFTHIIGLTALTAVAMDFITGTCTVKLWKKVDHIKSNKKQDFNLIKRRCSLK